MAARGAWVVLMARRAQPLQAVADRIAAAGTTTPLVVTGDTTSAADLERAVSAAVEQFGRLDYAVNCAGTVSRGPLLTSPMAEFDRVMEANVRGTVLALRAELPALLSQGGGAVVNVSSVSALVGAPASWAYATSKAAIVGLTRAVAAEFADRGVRVNAVAPGVTNTEMFSSADEDHRDRLLARIPLRRAADPSEIAVTIAYLLLDATFTTGTVVIADGGQSSI
jgi:NAD(P)-dependent dehydrogenase (short-subunit alcohol dehydrogenase family)